MVDFLRSERKVWPSFRDITDEKAFIEELKFWGIPTKAPSSSPALDQVQLYESHYPTSVNNPNRSNVFVKPAFNKSSSKSRAVKVTNANQKSPATLNNSKSSSKNDFQDKKYWIEELNKVTGSDEAGLPVKL